MPFPAMEAAARHLLLEPEVDAIRKWLQHSKNGGSSSLDVKVVKSAMREALNEGKPEGEISLWNFVNGITEAAHDTDVLARRVELEAMGYKALVRFGVKLELAA